MVIKRELRREGGRGSLTCAGTEGNKTNYKSKVNAE